MHTPLRSGSVAITAALAITLAGCGTDKASDKPTSASSQTTTTTTTTTQKALAPSPTPVAGPNQTIADYLRENSVVQTPVHRGDPGTPTLNLPTPPGWVDAGNRTPDWAWGAIISAAPETQADPPTIIAVISKLTGNVDPAKILELAPNEFKNTPGYEIQGTGGSSKLGGFEAFQIGASYSRDGAQRMIAQKTVVVPGSDAVYLLQLNADGSEDQLGALLDATSVIDDQTTITP